MKKYILLGLISSNVLAGHDSGIIDLIELETRNNHQDLQVSFGENKGNKFCSGNDVQYPDNAYLASSENNFDAIYSALLAAYVAQKKVRIETTYDAEQGKRCIIKKVRLL
ncbi:hypothetical protein F7Q91_09190 [Vibrio chagasii]|uniref:Uncharacterized protein n=1 Tax=Vibrio chagasii TaxID=170679 RepID=A0A7V7NV46_9VIBR|nr:hypothetical protein [Vibrio chagasii]KAB0480288.1 hypothetical protein F7Q91_09190 [Vibrio chagasii]